MRRSTPDPPLRDVQSGLLGPPPVSSFAASTAGRTAFSGLRRGGRFGGAGVDSSSPIGTTNDKDQIVQRTDVDASGSRLAAVNAGYLHDPFAALLHCDPDGSEDAERNPRRFPLINRGTYTRTTAIDLLVERFLGGVHGGKQIVSLGAGSDTRYWRLKAGGAGKEWIRGMVYHELDFVEVTKKKAGRVERWRELKSVLSTGSSSTSATEGHGIGDIKIDVEKGTIDAPDYHLHPIDLRTIKPPPSPTSPSPLPPTIDTTLPTLIISECCLIYLSPSEADSILHFFTSTFTLSHPLSIILYEPIGGDDAFGKVMVQNLASRGIVLKTLKKYSSLERQRERLRMLGFKAGQKAADVDWIWENWVEKGEKGGLGRLEMLDEVEEWRLLARHYAVVWGWRNGDRGGRGEGESEGEWEGWKEVKEQES